MQKKEYQITNLGEESYTKGNREILLFNAATKLTPLQKKPRDEMIKKMEGVKDCTRFQDTRSSIVMTDELHLDVKYIENPSFQEISGEVYQLEVQAKQMQRGGGKPTYGTIFISPYDQYKAEYIASAMQKSIDQQKAYYVLGEYAYSYLNKNMS